MARHAGPVIVVLLLLSAVALRALTSTQAQRLLEGERKGLATLLVLHRASLDALAGERAHPGLGPLAHLVPGAELLPASDAQLSFLRADPYAYGLSTTATRDATGRLLHGFVLRAWPLRYGETGNLEYLVQDGQLWEGSNRVGRSGTSVGFPPPFPEPAAGQDERAWWRLPFEAASVLHK